LQNNFSVEDKIKDRVISMATEHFSLIKFPYVDEDFQNLSGKYIYYESSRGCLFKCLYCLSSNYDQKLEFRNLNQVKTELDYLVTKNIKLIKFIDRTFNANPNHQEIWKHIIENFSQNSQNKIKFHFEIHAELLNDEDFKILEPVTADLFQFEIGIQSLNEEALQSVNRKSNLSLLKNNISKLIALKNIHIHLDLLAGLPEEDYNSFTQGFDEVYKFKADYIQIGILKLIPGINLREFAGIEYHNTPPYRVKSTNKLLENEIEDIFIASSGNDLVVNSGNFKTTVNNIMKHYSSPFKAILDFSKFLFCEYSLNDKQRNIDTIGYGLYLWYSQNFDDADYILDCLRFDFCITSKNKYPEYLKSEKCRAFKKKCFSMFKNQKQNVIASQAIDFDKLKFKKAKYFVPNTERFLKEYFLGYCGYCEYQGIIFFEDETNVYLKFSNEL
jgi:anaerobic magnesium-protoporphyrin IX monomethyl ester cyclase